MNNLSFAAGKFAKGFLTGSGAALTASLSAQGCNVPDLKTFGIAVIVGAGSGLIHMLWNLFFNAPATPQA